MWWCREFGWCVSKTAWRTAGFFQSSTGANQFTVGKGALCTGRGECSGKMRFTVPGVHLLIYVQICPDMDRHIQTGTVGFPPKIAMFLLVQKHALRFPVLDPHVLIQPTNICLPSLTRHATTTGSTGATGNSPHLIAPACGVAPEHRTPAKPWLCANDVNQGAVLPSR